MEEEQLKIDVHFVNFYNGFLALLASHPAEGATCKKLMTQLKLQHGAHLLGKCGAYAHVYNALLCQPRTRPMVQQAVSKGLPLQLVVESVLLLIA